MEEMDYGDILKYLPPEKQQELLDMRKRLAEKAGVGYMPDKPSQTKHLTSSQKGENKMSVLKRLYMEAYAPLRKPFPMTQNTASCQTKPARNESILSKYYRQRTGNVFKNGTKWFSATRT